LVCRDYVVLTGYVPPGGSIPRVVYLLSSRGVRVVSVNEELRRIVAVSTFDGVGFLIESCGGLIGDCMFTVKYSCKLSGCSGFLRSIGFTFTGRVAYGVVDGRIVEVEFGRVVRVKVGRRTRVRRVRPPIPQGVFSHPPGEVLDAVRDAGGIIGFLEDGCSG